MTDALCTGSYVIPQEHAYNVPTPRRARIRDLFQRDSSSPTVSLGECSGAEATATMNSDDEAFTPLIRPPTRPLPRLRSARSRRDSRGS